MKVRLSTSSELTPELIKSLIDSHKTEINRLNKLENYYSSKSPIMNRKMKDLSKPNNKLINNYAKYITTMATGYFVGVPIQMRCKDENLLNRLLAILKYNDDADLNTVLATNNSKYGYSYELHYMDEDGRNRIAAVDPREIIYITENTLNDEPKMVIRYFEQPTLLSNKETVYTVEVYTKDTITTYNLKNDNLLLIDQIQHPFKDIPVIRYSNNLDETGDYEAVTTLIDSYDKVQSDTANDFEYFTDAYLKITGTVIEEDQARMLKELRVFNFQDATGDVSFVTKNINDTAVENFKDRLDSDIHKFAFTPNMADENFVGNSSGVAMAYKLQGLEFLTGIKEQKFRKGLLRRIELLSNVLSIRTNTDISFIDVEFIFTRNNPKNLLEIVEMTTELSGIISKETQLDLLPMVDKDQEVKRLDIEKELQKQEFTSYKFDDIYMYDTSMKAGDSNESN